MNDDEKRAVAHAYAARHGLEWVQMQPGDNPKRCENCILNQREGHTSTGVCHAAPGCQIDDHTHYYTEQTYKNVTISFTEPEPP